MQGALQKSTKRHIKTKSIKKYPLLITPNYKPQLLYLPNQYKITPSSAQIFNNNFIIENLLIQTQLSKIQWKGIIDLSNLMQPLSETIKLNVCNVEVYINNHGKPKQGLELNRKCFATFISSKKLKRKALTKICQRNGTQLLSIDFDKNSFKVQIPHFTQYDFNNINDNESSQEENDETQKRNNKIVNNNKMAQNSNFNDKKLQKQTIPVQKMSYQNQSMNFTSTISKNTQKSTSKIRNFNNQKPFPNPNGTLSGDVNNHNKEVENYIKLFSQQIHFSTNDQALQINRRKNDYQIRQVIRKRDQQNELLNLFFSSVLNNNDQEIDQLVRSQHENIVPFKLKRIASLMQILFNYDKSKINFKKIQQRNNVYKELILSDKLKKSISFQQKIKNWIQWMVINPNNKIPQLQDNIYKFLVLRKPSELAQLYKKPNQVDNAQFLCSIQDIMYRDDKTQIKLKSQLQGIANQINGSLPNMHWLYEMGIQIWYFLRTQFQQRIKNTLKNHTENIESNYEQFRLFSIYLGKQINQYIVLKSDPNQQNLYDLIGSWMISYKLKDYEEKHYKRGNYEKYRYDLLKNITFKLHKMFHILKFIENQNYLDRQVKHELLRSILMKNPQFCNQLMHQKYQGKQDLINEVRGFQLISKFQYDAALKHFLQIKSYSLILSLKETIIQIANDTTLVLHFDQDIVEKHYQLINKIKYQQLSILKIILQMRLGYKPINQESLKILFKYVESIDKEEGHALMNLLFDKIQNCKNLTQIWKQNKSIYEKILNLYEGNKKALRLFKILKLNYNCN